MSMTVKRGIDIIGGSLGLILFLPVMATVAGLIWVSMGWPVLFRQERPGLDCKPFILLKFRTMTDAWDQQENLLDDAERLTFLGKILQYSSLDELPQLFNVLRGEMSLVGPRPLLMEYLCRYSPEQLRRHEMKPGLTGLAQVKGRKAVTWERKFQLDLWYVDNWSLVLDFKILVMTVGRLFSRSGLNEAGAPSSLFTGRESQGR